MYVPTAYAEQQQAIAELWAWLNTCINMLDMSYACSLDVMRDAQRMVEKHRPESEKQP